MDLFYLSPVPRNNGKSPSDFGGDCAPVESDA